MKQLVFVVLFILVFLGCKTPEDKLTAEEIVNSSIKASGTDKFNQAIVQFQFRDYTYKSDIGCGANLLERIKVDTSSTVQDQLIYPKLTRKINDKRVFLDDSIANLYGESINSVHYFVQLPMRLNDPAAIKSYLGKEIIKGRDYHVVAVQFQEEGGGQDFQDVYRYWFDVESFQLQYLAYTFLVNGGGIRFREVTSETFVEGIRFVNYNNYAPESNNTSIENIAKLYEKDGLKLVSSIENSAISVVIKECD